MRKMRVEIAIAALLLASLLGYGIGYVCMVKPEPQRAAAYGAADWLQTSVRTAGRIVT